MVALYSSLKSLPALAVGALAIANLPALPRDGTTPVQEHIALGGQDSMSIAWNTYAKLKGKACVQYGTSEHSLHSLACSDKPSTTYPTSRTWFHEVLITRLKPATRYYYKIVSTNSTIESFLSPRFPGDKTPFGMSVVIDLGVVGPDGYNIGMDQSKRDLIPHIPPSLNHTTIQSLAQTSDQWEVTVHPGDFAYADNWMNSDHNLPDGIDAYQAILEQFFVQLAFIAGHKPYMGGPGNHEAACFERANETQFCADGQRNFTDFAYRFANMPKTYPSTSKDKNAKVQANKATRLSNPPFWYSFEYGMMHFTMIDTETDFPNAPDQPGGDAGLNSGPFGFSDQQLEFIKADLASVDRRVTPWLIVGAHRPWNQAGDPSSSCTSCQDAFEGLFYEYGVDLAIFGHVHNSQCYKPIFNGKPDQAGFHDPKAPMYIVAGGSGNIEGLVSVNNTGIEDTVPFVYSDDYSYATVKFEDAQNLKVTFIRSSTGEILFEQSLFKSHKEAFPVQNIPK